MDCQTLLAMMGMPCQDLGIFLLILREKRQVFER